MCQTIPTKDSDLLAQLRLRTIVGHRVKSTIIVYGYNCVWAQLCPCSIVCDDNLVWPQSNGHNRVWAQTCQDTNMSGHKHVRAQSCSHGRVGTIMYGHKRGGTEWIFLDI